MQLVIESHFDELRRKKGLHDKKDISTRAVAREANLSLSAVQRVASKDPKKLAGVSVGTLEKLCIYFGVSIGDIIECKAD